MIIEKKNKPGKLGEGLLEEPIQEEIEEFIETDLKSIIVIPLTAILNIKLTGSDGCYEVEFYLRYSNKFTIIFNDEYQNISETFERCIRGVISLVKGVKETIASSWVTKYKRIFGRVTELQAKEIVKDDIAQYMKYLRDLLKISDKDKFFDYKGNIEPVGEGSLKTYEAKYCSTYPQFLFIPK